MPTVAEQLRAAREAQKLTVQQVADATKIRTDHIRALEEGNFSVFSAPIYIRGSVKNYATLLKLDVPQHHGRARRRIEGRRKNSASRRRSPSRTRKPLDRVMFLLAKLNLKWALAAAAILGGRLDCRWWCTGRGTSHKSSDPLAELAAGRLSAGQFRRHAAAAEILKASRLPI